MRQQAAIAISRNIRAHIAKQSYRHLLGKGQIWRECQHALVKAGKLAPGEKVNLEKLSSMNLSALRQKLDKLTEQETAFFDRFTQQKFFATHFTDAELVSASSQGHVMSLRSRQKLNQRNIQFKQENTSLMDIKIKADDGFVFFSLECGKQPSKLYSRFGKNLYRVPFDSPAFTQVSWGALDDLLELQVKHPDRHIPGLSQDEAKAIEQHCIAPKKRDYKDANAYSDIFAGKDLIPGAALAVISRLRKLPSSDSGLPSLADRLLASSAAADFNGLLNGIYRPEIRVPTHFFSADFQKFSNEELAEMKRNPASAWHEPSFVEKFTKYPGLNSKSSVTAALQAWIDEGADINEKDNLGDTVTIFAVHHSLTTALQVLIEKGADINAKNNKGRTALMIAAYYSHIPALQTLLRAGANTEAKNNTGATALMIAAYKGHVPALQALLRANVNKNAVDKEGCTALMIAAYYGHVPVLQTLLRVRANTEVKNKNGLTALMFAAYKGHAPALQALLGANVNKNSVDKEGCTALMIAAYYGHVPALQTLLSAGAKVDVLGAVMKGHAGTVSMLIQHSPGAIKGFMAAAKGNGEPAMKAKAILLEVLLSQAQEDATPDVQKLIEAGADKIQDAQGKTVLMRAVDMMASGNEQGLRALKALLKAGADITIRDNESNTVSDYAAALAIQQPNPNDQALVALKAPKENAGSRMFRR